jgi:hypothetical protein
MDFKWFDISINPAKAMLDIHKKLLKRFSEYLPTHKAVDRKFEIIFLSTLII